MTVTVRLPTVLEETLATYCIERGITRSEAIKQAISRLVTAERDAPAAYDLGRDLFGPETDLVPTDDVAANTKRLLRKRFRK
jgi:hypothetical protein